MDIKTVRKQIRNVCQELLPTILADVLGQDLMEKLKKENANLINARCEVIDEYVKTNLGKQDKRSKDVQGFLMGQVKVGMQQRAEDMDRTIEAMIDVMEQSGVIIENFKDKVVEQKKVVAERREKEAVANMQSQLEQRKAEADAEESKDAAPAVGETI